ncbi:hypothetical protein [Paenibacillus sp. 22594]|uniref:hypothetical protein n=1 Tax=Paenibacillus sp. 22594 TaxID=3453947 RepID=UPI003F83D56E
MVFAKNDAEYNKLKEEMITKSKGLGYDEAVAFEVGNAEKKGFPKQISFYICRIRKPVVQRDLVNRLFLKKSYTGVRHEVVQWLKHTGGNLGWRPAPQLGAGGYTAEANLFKRQFQR